MYCSKQTSPLFKQASPAGRWEKGAKGNLAKISLHRALILLCNTLIDWLTLPKDLKHFITKTIIECHQEFMGTSSLTFKEAISTSLKAINLTKKPRQSHRWTLLL